MSVFVHAQGMKTVHAGGGGQKNGKILSTQFLNAPYSWKNGTKTACALAEQICFEMHKRKIDFVASNVTN